MRLCEDFASVGTGSVAMMGGEPFLRNDWRDVAQCIRQLGMNLNIVTNGTLMDENIDELAKLEPQVVGVSIDGMRGAHETVRGPGTWSKTMRALDLLEEHGIQTTVITTVSKTNFEDLPMMRDHFEHRNINWQVQTAMPFGNFLREQTLSVEEFYAAALFLAKNRIRNRFENLPVVGAHCFGYFSRMMPTPSWRGCTAGISTVGITSDGGVVGCLSMGNDRYIEGNVRERRFPEIWRDPEAFAYNRRFDVSHLGDNCRGCRHGSRCRGGCSSVSLSLTGRLHNNPYCLKRYEESEGARR